MLSGNKIMRFRVFQSLKFQFIFYFLLFSFVPLVIFSVLGFFLNQNIIENIHKTNLRHNSVRVSKQLHNFFSGRDELAKSIYLIYITDHDNSEQLMKNSEFYAIFDSLELAIFRSGSVVFQTLNNYEKIAYMQKALNNFDYTLIILPNNNIFYKTKINDQYTVFQSIKLNTISSILDFSDPSVHAKLVSRSGNYSISGQGIKFEQKAQQRVSLNQGNDAFLMQINEIDNDLILFSYKAKSGIDSELISFLSDILIANLIIGLLVLLGAIFFSKKIITPIESLVNAVKKISKGDLDESISVESEDEIKTLADEFEKMRLRLKESYVGLENKIEERTQALRDAQFQISHQEKMASLGLLAAGVAHEIGNPLTSISSMAQIIKRKVKDQNFVEYLNTILKNIERIRKIVRELVDFARPSSYEAADTDINEIIRNAVGIVKYDRRAKSINIDLELDNKLPTVFLVSDQLLQVFINMLINAVDALTEDRNRIVIRSQKQGPDIVIQFEDEGVGIEPENVSKIFEPFYTTKRVGKGTGLGLSVSYGIIKNLNGRIDVESEPGRGSVFTITLPRKQE
jgi:signal transduction histidine kinase